MLESNIELASDILHNTEYHIEVVDTGSRSYNMIVTHAVLGLLAWMASKEHRVFVISKASKGYLKPVRMELDGNKLFVIMSMGRTDTSSSLHLQATDAIEALVLQEYSVVSGWPLFLVGLHNETHRHDSPSLCFVAGVPL